MANIIIWGKSRDLIPGSLPPGISGREVSSFSQLQEHLDSKGGTLVLVGPAQLEADKASIESWLKEGGNLRALFVGVCEPAEADEALRLYPFLDDLLLRPVSPGRLRLRLERSLDAVHNRRVIDQLDRALVRKSGELHDLNKIGVALSAERDINKLLELILAKCREITAADAGSLYLVERGREDA